MNINRELDTEYFEPLIFQCSECKKMSSEEEIFHRRNKSWSYQCPHCKALFRYKDGRWEMKGAKEG